MSHDLGKLAVYGVLIVKPFREVIWKAYFVSSYSDVSAEYVSKK